MEYGRDWSESLVTAKIYIEGGGEGEFLDTLFRQAWTRFFNEAGLSGRMPRVVRGQGRNNTFDAFRLAVANPKKDELPLLLVDSEDAVATGHSVWTHLKVRDGWDRPLPASDDQAFLMVQVMETWFLADRDAVVRFFGPKFIGRHIHSWPNLEAVPKKTILGALELATAGCTKPYDTNNKGRVSFELLRKLDPSKVEASCPSARALLDRLRSL